MRDHELIDQLLRDAMAVDVPQPSAGFDARVMARVRPRRLSTAGRATMAAYAVVAAGATAWLMHDLSAALVTCALMATAGVAAGVSAYVRWLAIRP
jgi:hypothetical protein